MKRAAHRVGAGRGRRGGLLGGTAPGRPALVASVRHACWSCQPRACRGHHPAPRPRTPDQGVARAADLLLDLLLAHAAQAGVVHRVRRQLVALEEQALCRSTVKGAGPGACIPALTEGSHSGAGGLQARAAARVGWRGCGAANPTRVPGPLHGGQCRGSCAAPSPRGGHVAAVGVLDGVGQAQHQLGGFPGHVVVVAAGVGQTRWRMLGGRPTAAHSQGPLRPTEQRCASGVGAGGGAGCTPPT